LQFGLSALGAGAVVVGVGALWAEWTAMDASSVLWAAAILIVLGLIIGWSDAPRSRRQRQLARDALFPGDVGPAEDEAPKTSRTRRRR
jgi:hypothetical protein